MSSSHNIFKLICLPKLERPSIIPSIDLKKTELDNIFEIRSYAERRLLKFNLRYVEYFLILLKLLHISQILSRIIIL